MDPLDLDKDESSFDLLLKAAAQDCNVNTENNNLFVRGKQLCSFEKKGNNNY